MLRDPSLLFTMLRNRLANSTALFALFAASAGGVWGLALARVLAESCPNSPTFELGPSLLVALVAALVTLGVGLMLRLRPDFGGRCEGAERRGVSPSIVGVGEVEALLLAVVYIFWPVVAPRVGWILLAGSLMLTMLLVVRKAQWVSGAEAVLSYKRLVVSFMVCVIVVLYLRTLGPTVGQADTFEFQVVAPRWGIAHPTGYPLYILSGKLFSLLPFGSVAWRVNLSSAIFGTVAAVLLFQMIYRLTARPLVALVATLGLAFSRVFWSQAVVAEVYTLHNMFVAAVLLLLLGAVSGEWQDTGSWGERRQGSTSKGVGNPGRLALNPVYAVSLLLGLSFSNHLTTGLLLPAVVFTLSIVRPSMGRRDWSIAAGLFLLGLSLYLYVLFRWPMLHDGVWMSPGELWRYVTGQQFGGALRLDAWRTDPTRYQIIGRLLREPFGWPGLILSAVGMVWLAIKRWRVALITMLTFLVYGWYCLSYYVPDVSVFLLPAHLVLAVWLGVGMAAILNMVGDLARRARGSDLGTAQRTTRCEGSVTLLVLFALLPLWLLWVNLPLVDQSGEREAYAWGDRVLALPIARDAAVLADSVRIAPLYYLQRIEGRRPDLDILVVADELTYRTELETRLTAGQTVYLARFLPGLESLYHLRSLGPLTEVGMAPLIELPPLDLALGVRFAGDAGLPVSQEPSIELLGITGPVSGPDGGTGLTLYWRTDAPVAEAYHVRLRLVDRKGQVWWQGEGRHAANNYYPTQAWRAGEVVVDYHEIPPLAIESTVSRNDYVVQVGLARPFSDEGLATESGEMWYSLFPLDSPPLAEGATPRYPLRVRFADPGGSTVSSSGGTSRLRRSGDVLTLLGVDLPDVVAAGALVELRLHLPRNVTPGAKWRLGDAGVQELLVLTWVDREGSRVEAPVLELWGWSRVLIRAPTSPGDYGLRLGLVDPQRRFLPARCGWLGRPTKDCAVASVRVTRAASTALANFDGQMLLLDAELDVAMPSVGSTPVLSPSQAMLVTLTWQGLRRMEEDYTVSVQLVGPDGRLHGQTDAWPVQGTLPTSQWLPGQRITDPYHVVLSPDAPVGRYQVGVVVYLLANQTRLPLVDGMGRARGDIAWAGELEVAER